MALVTKIKSKYNELDVITFYNEQTESLNVQISNNDLDQVKFIQIDLDQAKQLGFVLTLIAEGRRAPICVTPRCRGIGENKYNGTCRICWEEGHNWPEQAKEKVDD